MNCGVSKNYLRLQLSFMRALLVLMAAASFAACNNSSTARTFCDTACANDSFVFSGPSGANETVAIGLRNCRPDSMIWMHDYADSKLTKFSDYIGQDVTLNKSAMGCYFNDTLYAWLEFNDCTTGRGYLLQLPFSKSRSRQTIKGALTRFDPKFSIEQDLVAYTDRGSVFVEDVKTGKKALMPFDKQYDIDFDKLHETVDSVNITKSRIFVRMLRDGKEVPYEKKVTL